jgi:DME family drug/metabolite transporter
MKTKGFFYIICAGILWGFVGPFSKLAFKEGVSPLEVAFWRALLAWILFAFHAAAERQVKIASKDILAVVIFGVTGVTLFYGSYQLAVEKGGAALASMLLYTAPAWVAVMSAFFFKEAMTLLKLSALALTILGVIGVSAGSRGIGAYAGIEVSAMAVVFGLLSGFFYSLYYIFGKRFSARYSSPSLFLYMLAIGALGLFPAVHFVEKTMMAWIALVCLALFSTYGAYYFYYLGLKYLEPSRAAITATIEPVVATIVAHLWWNESFTPVGYVGSALILTAVILVVRDGAKATVTSI